MKNARFLITLGLSLLISLTTISQNSEYREIMVEDINDDLNEELVSIKGTIKQTDISPGESTFNYILEDFSGDIVRVNTKSNLKPNEFKKNYTVKGRLIFNGQTSKIMEDSRTPIDEIGGYDDSRDEGDKPYDGSVEREKKKAKSFIEEYGLYLLIGLLFIVIVIIGVIILNRKNNEGSFTGGSGQVSSDAFVNTQKRASYPESPKSEPVEYSEGYSTLKVPQQEDQGGNQTLKMNTGKLEVTSGADVGKSIPVIGAPGPEGSVMSFGRNAQGWKNKIPKDREKYHILIEDPTGTMSRLQAELIVSNNKLYLRNKSDVNRTKLNGKEVGVDEKVEVKNNDEISAGNIKFEYRI